MASVGKTPTSGTHESTAFKITCAATASNDTGSFDSTKYPTEPQITYQFVCTASNQQTLTSHVFSTDSTGVAEWDGVIFPAAATWTVTLTKVSDSSSVATTTIAVA